MEIGANADGETGSPRSSPCSRSPRSGSYSVPRFAPAVRAGIRFVRFSPPVRTVLFRGAAFWMLLGPVMRMHGQRIKNLQQQQQQAQSQQQQGQQ